MSKIRLLVLAGGKSAEHQISLISAWNLCTKVDSNSFELSLITIDPEGNWFLQSIKDFVQQSPNPDTIHFGTTERPVFIVPGNGEQKFYLSEQNQFLPKVDVVFPLLHGPYGEDGSMQGLLVQAQIPFIGPEVLGSAICMDKAIAKQLMIENGIPTSKFLVTTEQEGIIPFEQVEQELGLPCFVKPANLGSSVGINKVTNREDYLAAMLEAFSFDKKVIIEEFIKGIEVECAVIGSDELTVSPPGTYVFSDDFFDFDTKYKKQNEVVMQIPAQALSEQQQAEVRQISEKAFRALQCDIIARVDTFFTENEEFFVNEINTLPGFTSSSMYPLLLEKVGISYNELVKQLCNLAMKRG